MTHVCVGLRNMEKLEGIFQLGKLEHTGKVGEISNKILEKFKQMLFILTDI